MFGQNAYGPDFLNLHCTAPDPLAQTLFNIPPRPGLVPDHSANGNVIIYCDATTGTFKASFNGGSYGSLQTMVVINVRDYGARGNGNVALDCSMTSGSSVLTCNSSHFVASDVGKVIMVGEAGPTNNGFVQPLSSTILSYQSGTQVTLNSNASASTTQTISTLSSCARARGTGGNAVVTCNTVANHNLVVGQRAVIISAGSVDSTIVDPIGFPVQSTPSGTQFTFYERWPGYADNPTLTVTGGTVSGYSSRVVWGTNDDTALQAAIDACALNGGCTVIFPAQAPLGIYMTHGISLPCSAIGNFTSVGLGICTKAYNNITLQGDGMDATSLESWDISINPSVLTGLITIGGQADQYPYNFTSGGPLAPVKNIEIRNMGFRQPRNMTHSIKGIAVNNVDGLRIHHTKMFSGSYEGYYIGGINTNVHDNFCTTSGLGGPASVTALACYNIIGAWQNFHNNYATNVGQCAEAGNPHEWFTNNVCDGLGADANNGVSPHYFMNITSNSFGTWDVHVTENNENNFDGSILGNSLGIYKDSEFSRNSLVDDAGGLSITSGKETNNVNVWPQNNPGSHGSTAISGNRFINTKNSRSATYIIATQNPVENINISDNSITYAGPRCSLTPFAICSVDADCTGGASCTISSGVADLESTAQWQASHAYTCTVSQPCFVVPIGGNGFLYDSTSNCTSNSGGGPAFPTTPTGATVSDNTCTWTLYSHAQRITLANTTVQAPDSAEPFGIINQELNIPNGDLSSLVAVSNFRYNLQTKFQHDGASFLLPPNTIYSDSSLASSDCAAKGTAASPSIASCGSAPRGSFSCDPAASGGLCRVLTSAVTANSEIIITVNQAKGSKLGVTCNTSPTMPAILLFSLQAGANFQINAPTFITNPVCFDFVIDN